jgi:hypothetical protein
MNRRHLRASAPLTSRKTPHAAAFAEEWKKYTREESNL